MKLQQLRYIWEIAHHDLNVSATAQSLYTSQSGISKQVRLLEDELGVEIFSRSGKHLLRVTPAGKAILRMAEEILYKVENIKKVAEEFSNDKKGSLSLATSYTQARYVLPKIIDNFTDRHPEVSLHVHQGTPVQISEMASNGSVDLAIATEDVQLFSNLIMMPCYQWNHCIIVPRNHPLCQLSTLTLHTIARYPIVTYVSGFTGRSQLDEAFFAQKISSKIACTAVDADVIKTYVRLGLGVGIIAEMAYSSDDDSDLVALDVSHLFKPSITKIGFRRGAFLRNFMYEFIQDFAPHLNKAVVNEAYSCTSKLEQNELFEHMQLPSY